MDTLAEAESRGEYTTLDASGLAVGIPAGVMGNSEVGHFTIGTGRVAYQVWRGGREGRREGGMSSHNLYHSFMQTYQHAPKLS